MRWPLVFLAAGMPLLSARGASSDWLSAPKPKFPATALEKGYEGSVSLRLVLAKDGGVRSAEVIKSSGDPILDQTAQTTVLRWKMKPSAIQPADLERGRVEIVEFKEEAIMAASYPGRVKAGFTSENIWRPWKYAPFPYYPMESRLRHHFGAVVLNASIGNNGNVTLVKIIKSSGYPDLDEAAEIAVRHWQAHKEFIGKALRVPVNFSLTRR